MKIKIFLSLFLLGFIVLALAPVSFAQEKGCLEISGWLIYPEKDASPTIKEMHCGKEKTFRLVTSGDILLATMPVPELPAGYEFNHGECRLDGVIRNDIIAMVRHKDDGEWSTDILKAWIADPVAKEFRPFPVKGIICLNIGYGI